MPCYIIALIAVFHWCLDSHKVERFTPEPWFDWPALCLNCWPLRTSYKGPNMCKCSRSGQYGGCGNNSQARSCSMWVVFVNDCVYGSLRQMGLFHKLATSYLLILKNQTFHLLFMFTGTIAMSSEPPRPGLSFTELAAFQSFTAA